VRIDVLTIFPEIFAGFLGESIINRAQEQGLVQIFLNDIRQYATDKHSTVDDYPFGGGPGMVMKPEPVFRAVEAVQAEAAPGELILLTPQGERYDHRLAKELSGEQRLVLVCGRYKGVDERIRTLANREISIGDYVLTGGELPAMVVIDSVVRLMPGVLGDEESAESDSFFEGLLEAPQYTRPQLFRDMGIPDVLISGNHAQIREWRHREALRKTLRRRPDLLDAVSLSDEERKLLEEVREEEGG
jgi:tRNA (guanine37-N1)-methyltransferase